MSRSGRTVIDFDGGWRFMKLTQKDGLSELAVHAIGFDDGAWEPVELPHTWNAVDGADGRSGVDEGGEHYYRGLGGYRKTYVFRPNFLASGFLWNLRARTPSPSCT